MELALASIRQAMDPRDVSVARRLHKDPTQEISEHEEWEVIQEKEEHEPVEKIDQVERLEPSDYEGFPKQKREYVSDEQRDTKEIFEDNAEAIGQGFLKKMGRFNELMACWKTLPNYDPNFKADLE